MTVWVSESEAEYHEDAEKVRIDGTATLLKLAKDGEGYALVKAFAPGSWLSVEPGKSKLFERLEQEQQEAYQAQQPRKNQVQFAMEVTASDIQVGTLVFFDHLEGNGEYVLTKKRPVRGGWDLTFNSVHGDRWTTNTYKGSDTFELWHQ